MKKIELLKISTILGLANTEVALNFKKHNKKKKIASITEATLRGRKVQILLKSAIALHSLVLNTAKIYCVAH